MITKNWQDSLPSGRRTEPAVISDMLIDTEPLSDSSVASSRFMPAAVLLSLLAHILVLAIVAWTTNRPARLQQPETIARTSIQIRIQQPAPAAVEVSSESSETPSPPAPQASEISRSDAPDPATAPEPTTPETPALSSSAPPTQQSPIPRIQIPSLTELRSATQRYLQHERAARHPCTVQQRRNELFNCDPEADNTERFEAAQMNTTYSYFNPPPTATQAPDSRLDTSNRTQSAIDLMDAQLGTTETRKRIMNIP